MTYVSHTTTDQCYNCHGKGKVRGADPEKPWQKPQMESCETCQGAGYIEETTMVDIAEELSGKDAIVEICNVLDDILERIEKIENSIASLEI